LQRTSARTRGCCTPSPAARADQCSHGEELRLIYEAKGLDADDARRLARRIIGGDQQVALDTMSREELGIDPRELGGSAWTAAITSFMLFAVGAMVPVIPFLIGSGTVAIVASALLAAIALFAVGAAITLLTARNPLVAGMRQVGFGLAAAAITFGIGTMLGTVVG